MLNVDIVSAQYANAENTIVFVFMSNGEQWTVVPANNSGQANILQDWVNSGNNIGPYYPVVPGGVVPAGTVIWFGSQRVPTGYLLCDGSAVRRATYANLFRTVGVTFGSGDGQSTFNLPNLVGRFIRGWGPVNPLDPGRSFGSYQTDIIGSHTHGITDPGHEHGVTDPGHVHLITDPTHTHVVSDPGHNHTFTDPGHVHNTQFESLGYAGAYNDQRESMSVGENQMNSQGKRNNGNVNWNTANATTGVTQNSAFTGITINNALTNIVDQDAVTRITINGSLINIPRTDPTGGFETRPANIAMLPCIRY